MKQCFTCKIEKSFNEFGLNKRKKDGYDSYCRICRNEKGKEQYQKNIKEERQRSRDKYAANPEKTKERNKKYKETNKRAVKNWEQNNKDWRREYHNNYSKNRKKNDPLFKVMGNMRIRINIFLKSINLKKQNKMLEILGINPTKLKEHLENQFIDGMSWENYGEWHIDHIVPLSTSKSIEEINRLCHYTNLQPLWAFDNISKGGIIKMNNQK